MTIKLRFRYGPKVTRKGRKNRKAALALASLLTPGVVTATCLGFWRLGADAGVASEFAIRDGIFSHWQVWFAVAGLGQFSSRLLNRYGGGQRFLRYSVEKSPETLETISDSEFTTSPRRS